MQNDGWENLVDAFPGAPQLVEQGPHLLADMLEDEGKVEDKIVVEHLLVGAAVVFAD